MRLAKIGWDEFIEKVRPIAPGYEYDRCSKLSDMPVFHRLAIVRWLSDLFEGSVDVRIVRQLETLGEAWEWVNSGLTDGLALQQSSVAAGAGVTSRVRLRPLIPEQDTMPLYLASFDPANATLWRFRGRTVSIDQFAARMFDGVLAQYMVVLPENDAAVGLVSAYDENPSGLNCKVAFIRCGNRFPGDSGAMFEGAMTFITHLFRTFPYRKIFAEMPAANAGLFNEGFAETEGILRDYLFHDGDFMDMHLISIKREAWENVHSATGW